MGVWAFRLAGSRLICGVQVLEWGGWFQPVARCTCATGAGRSAGGRCKSMRAEEGPRRAGEVDKGARVRQALTSGSTAAGLRLRGLVCTDPPARPPPPARRPVRAWSRTVCLRRNTRRQLTRRRRWAARSTWRSRPSCGPRATDVAPPPAAAAARARGGARALGVARLLPRAPQPHEAAGIDIGARAFGLRLVLGCPSLLPPLVTSCTVYDVCCGARAALTLAHP
jgi:hypothetical protein